LVKNSDVIIIAVKPKDVDTLLKCEVACGVSDKKLLISIAAGIATRHIEKIVGRDVPVVRAMPNMGAFIGEAISSVSAGTSADRDDMELSKRILSTIGDVIEIDERHVDAVTALSGSGPAYFFYLAESMIEVGKDLGLKEAVSSKLVLKTMLASARLLHVIERDPVVMRKKVTSKGGTTEAAFKIFESRGFKSIVKAAVVSAQKHSKKISSGGKDVRGR
jgi:pyrroline-5-carboxylate reductase